MLKYVDAIEGFIEVPSEINLCINFSGCQIKCKDCHSKYLWENSGTELTIDILKNLIDAHFGITCICFMGGYDYSYLNVLFAYTKKCGLKTCWYTGLNYIPKSLDLNVLDYVKIGPFIKEYGPLNCKDTNQKFFVVNHDKSNALENITFKFWKV